MIEQRENRINSEVKIQVRQLTIKPHWALFPVKGIRGPYEGGKERNLLKSVGFEPTTSGLDSS